MKNKLTLMDIPIILWKIIWFFIIIWYTLWLASCASDRSELLSLYASKALTWCDPSFETILLHFWYWIIIFIVILFIWWKIIKCIKSRKSNIEK